MRIRAGFAALLIVGLACVSTNQTGNGGREHDANQWVYLALPKDPAYVAGNCRAGGFPEGWLGGEAVRLTQPVVFSRRKDCCAASCFSYVLAVGDDGVTYVWQGGKEGFMAKKILDPAASQAVHDAVKRARLESLPDEILFAESEATVSQVALFNNGQMKCIDYMIPVGLPKSPELETILRLVVSVEAAVSPLSIPAP